MKQLEVIEVGFRNNQLHCEPCGTVIKRLDDVAMLLRHTPGGVFDPVCVDCALVVAQAARASLDALAEGTYRGLSIDFD